MHLEALVGAETEELGAAGSEVREPGDDCSGVEVVVCLRWIVAIRAPWSADRIDGGLEDCGDRVRVGDQGQV